jgi:putative DNA primase/helicase
MNAPIDALLQAKGFSLAELNNGRLSQFLSQFDCVEYDRMRRELAEALDIRKSTLDDAYKRCRPRLHETGQGTDVTFPTMKPWPESVDGARLLDELAAIYARHIILSKSGQDVLALWTLYSYVYDAFDVSPYLALTSPEKRCGKSTVLIVASALVYRPLLACNISSAALFRTIEAWTPTFHR